MKSLKIYLVLLYIFILAIVAPVVFKAENIFGDCYYRDVDGNRCDIPSTPAPPTTPGDSTGSGDSNKPSTPSDSTGSTDSNKPTSPTNPTGSGGSNGSGSSNGSTGSTKPTNPNNSGDSGDSGDTDSSGDNGGSSEPSSTPDFSAEALDNSQQELNKGEANVSSASNALGTAETQANTEITVNRSTTNDTENLKKADGSGDPVLVTSGSYLFDVEDYEINGSNFEIGRKYLSENKITGSMGTGWSSSIDSRVIRGMTKVNAGLLAQASSLLSSAAQCSAGIKAEASNLLAETKDMEPASRKEAEETHAKLMAMANSLDSKIQSGRQKLAALQAIKTRGEQLAALNKYAKFRGTPECYEVLGNEYLLLVDEDGIPQIFVPSGTGVWLPLNNPERLYMRLISVDGKGADSLAGFVVEERGGRKKHYNGYGLLTGITELNGDRVEIVRNAEQKITLIKGPHGSEWAVENNGDFISAINGPEKTSVKYGYSGNDLAWVKDQDGDTGSYGYTGGLLNRITKPDGSAIKIDYGYSGSDGSLMVSITTHEEGASEKFDYNPSQKATTYINHSGVITRYWYDGKHRTVREEHSDGSVKTYIYNEADLLELETLNGFEIRYSYDGRGNTTEKIYSDGKKESWMWSGNDQLLRYSDRDGVVTELLYDSRWNCVEVKRGGQVVYTASYDSRNRLVASKEGNRSEYRYEYDNRDFLTSRSATINGKEIKEEWKYDAFGRVLKYTDALGRIWEYTYNAKETIEKTPLALERRYEYNNRKDLVRITEKDLSTGETKESKYSYDKRHLLTEEKDGSGNVIKYTYREDGELIKKIQGPWYREYEYEAGGRISTATSGKTGTNKKYTENYEYQRQGWNEKRSVTISEAGTTAYLLDPWGQVTAITNAIGESSSRTLNGAGNALREQASSGGFYEYRYDALGRPYHAGREGGPAVQARYNLDGSIAEKTDRLGKVTQYAYDGRGLLTKEATALGEQRYFYDDAGRLIRQEIASRNSVTYRNDWSYNDSQRTVTVTAGGIYSETLYLNAWGEVIKKADGEGNETKYEYDKAGKLIKSIDAYGRATSYSYNELGKVAKVIFTDSTAEAYEYDHMGNLQEIRDALGVSWAGEYDQAGRLAKETGRPGIDKEYKYDAIGRIVEVKNGGEITERYSYSNRGREAVFTDALGANFTQHKNDFGELTGETNRLGDSQMYSYDGEGRVTTSAAYSGRQTKAEYRDSEGITITTYPDGKQSVIERDLLGNTMRAASETGTIRYKYDAGGKLIEQNDEGAGEITRYSYNKAGQRIRMQSGNRDIIYRYGKNGELLRVTDNSQRLEVTYEYDSRGREIRRAYGNGVRQETFYDQIGRIVLIREIDSRGGLLRAEGYLYDEKGRRSHSVDEEGRVTKYEYDRQSRLSAVLYPWTKEKAEADRREAEEAGLYFTLDKGNGERYSFSAAEQTALREILNKAGPMRGNAVASSQMAWRESYTYDRNGNRASKVTPWGIIKYTYDAENRLVKKGDVAYTYDKDGNTLSEKGLRYEAKYEYNGRNRMASSAVTSYVGNAHSAASYAYDALGRRTLTENEAGQTLRTLYDGKGFEAIREGETFRDGSFTTRYAPAEAAAGALSNQTTGERYRWVGDNESARARNSTDEYAVQNTRYNGRGVTLYGNGEAVAVSYSSGGASRSMYMGKDIMGSVRSVTADTGALEGRYEYDAFGQPYKGDLTGGMNLGYTGKPYDTATGLYNYGYRDYKPQAARFTTVDPIRDGNNWFAYVNNDPVNWRDLWGLKGMHTEAVGGGRSIDSSTNVNNLKTVQQTTREAEIYQKGGAGRYEGNATPTTTYCNLATFDIAEATGFNTSALYNGANRDNVNANKAAQNLAAAADNGTIVQVGGAQAQVLANTGYTVIAAWENTAKDNNGDELSGHLATVSPSGYGSTTPTISNVGEVNGIKSTTSAFGNNTPIYYYDPNQTFTFDTSNILKTNAKPKKSN